jgi:hypothetical protein
MNPNLAMFAQMAQRQSMQPQGAMGQPGPQMQRPQMPQQGGKPPQAGGMPPGAQMPQGGPQGAPQGGPQGPQNPIMAVANPALKQAAQQGEGGDNTMAHLTPGEMVIPPQMQTPKVLATLKAAFAQAGANPAQYTVGDPSMQMNSQTGAPQFSFSFADILPLVGTVAGSYFGGPWGGAAGGALGGAAAGASHGGGSGNMLTGAALGGVGGYMGGSGLQSAFPETFSGSAGMAGLGLGAGSGAGGGMGSVPGATPAGMDPTAAASFAAENTANPAQSAANNSMFSNMAAKQGGDDTSMLGGIGAWLKAHPQLALMGGAAGLAALTSGGSSNNGQVAMPAGFNTPMTPMSQLPDWRTKIGGQPNGSQFSSAPNAYSRYGYGPAQNFFGA